ncbi:MAG: hypothetical protein M3042_12130 [Actinomycetota bacterium]|nr:hypothetical protein [Actinomycetota bacterium]
MTDTRLPEHYLTSPGLDALTDPAHRVFVNGLMWSVTHGTDGELTRRSLRWLHPDPLLIGPACVELVAAGLWQEHGEGWLIVGFLDHQSAAADVQASREKAAAARRRQRAHARGDHSLCSPDSCTHAAMSGGDTAPRRGATPEDRTGQDSGYRTKYVTRPSGKTHEHRNTGNSESADDDEWAGLHVVGGAT